MVKSNGAWEFFTFSPAQYATRTTETAPHAFTVLELVKLIRHVRFTPIAVNRSAKTNVRFVPILLKKSVFANELIFSGALMRPPQNYVGDHVINPPSNVQAP